MPAVLEEGEATCTPETKPHLNLEGNGLNQVAQPAGSQWQTRLKRNGVRVDLLRDGNVDGPGSAKPAGPVGGGV